MSYPITYILGTEMTLRGTFKNEAGVLTDPNSVACSVARPDGSTDHPVATRETTGVWKASYTPDAVGAYSWRMAGTGGLITSIANEESFLCQTSF